MRPLGVRWRLTLWHVGVLAAAQVLMITAVAVSQRAASLRTVDRELQQKARQAIGAGPERERRQAPNGTDFRRPRWVRHDDPADAAWDPAGRRLPAGDVRRLASVWVGRQHARILSLPWIENSRVVGVLQVARPLAGHDEAQLGVLRMSLLLCPLTLLIAALGGVWLTNRALGPVRSMTRAAAEIGAEDLSRRLDVLGDDELAELAATFNGMIARLETAFEQQRRFTADASHELRTPLARIKVSTSLALSGEPDAEADRQALRVADQAADGMARLLDQLLFLARADADQLGLEPAQLAADALCREALAALPLGAADRIAYAPPAADLRLSGDPDHLCRALVNLLGNALRHTPETAAIRLSASPAGEVVELRVVDAGPGVPAEALGRLTDRFFRVDKARSRGAGGTGLGLSIVASIVRAHGGALRFEPTPGGGLTVILAIPRA